MDRPEERATLCSSWPNWLHDAVTEATELADAKDWSTEQVVGYAILKAREEAFEEAAKIAERMHSYAKVQLEWDEDGKPVETPAGLAGPGDDIASAIRQHSQKGER